MSFLWKEETFAKDANDFENNYKLLSVWSMVRDESVSSKWWHCKIHDYTLHICEFFQCQDPPEPFRCPWSSFPPPLFLRPCLCNIFPFLFLLILRSEHVLVDVVNRFSSKSFDLEQSRSYIVIVLEPLSNL